jgi:hypothetical protein
MKLNEVVKLLREAAAFGTSKALENSAAMPARLTKAEAYRHYGRTQVDRWISEGLLQVTRHAYSSKIMIDRSKLEAVAAASNRVTYLPVAER